MRTLGELEHEIESLSSREALLAAAETALEHWIVARGAVPTGARREGFRVLALHRQGAQGEPSFNACRESCREIAYHYNLLGEEASPRTLQMMQLLVMHLVLFVGGKLQVAGLGEFCCASRPLRNGKEETHA